MKRKPRTFVHWILGGLLVAGSFSGCALPKIKTARTPEEHAFISYWPPPPGDKKLRLAVKDMIDLKGYVTTAGCQFLENTRKPATRDAECMQIARERGVRIVGKANTTELALGVSGINEYYGTPKSPQRPKGKLISGGSSSGSAVSVAAGLADVAFGTDTAGSIRVPSACCGVYGLKTTYGLVSLKGVTPVSPEHLDTVGPMASDVARLAIGMDLLERGFAAKYRSAQASEPTGKSIRVGRLYLKGTDPDVDRAIDAAIAAAGFQVVNLSEEFRKAWDQAQKDGNRLALADSWRTDSKYLTGLGVTAITRASIQLGQIEYTLNYKELMERRPLWQRALNRVFRQVDFVALPTLQKVPLKIPFWGRTAVFEARVLSMQNTVPVNYAGSPAIAIPVPVEGERVPMTSLQLVGPRLSEARLVNAARIVEAAMKKDVVVAAHQERP
jgi:amidase